MKSVWTHIWQGDDQVTLHYGDIENLALLHDGNVTIERVISGSQGFDFMFDKGSRMLKIQSLFSSEQCCGKLCIRFMTSLASQTTPKQYIKF